MPVQISYKLAEPRPTKAMEEVSTEIPSCPRTCLDDCIREVGLPKYSPNYLATLHHHKNDDRIRFIEYSHTYYVNWSDGFKAKSISVSALVHAYFEEFDADKVLSKMGRSRVNASSPYFGLSCATIKEMWRLNGEKASSQGTFIHELLEMEMNGFDLCNSAYQDIIRVRQYLDWKKTHFDLKFIPYRTEMRLMSDSPALVTGTIDLLCVRKDHGCPEDTGGVLHVHIKDWKCAKSIKVSNRFQSGIGLCSHLDDTNYSSYSLQQNAYLYMLERYQNFTFRGRIFDRIIVDTIELVVVHENHDSAIIVPITINRELMGRIFEERRQKVAQDVNDENN